MLYTGQNPHFGRSGVDAGRKSGDFYRNRCSGAALRPCALPEIGPGMVRPPWVACGSIPAPFHPLPGAIWAPGRARGASFMLVTQRVAGNLIRLREMRSKRLLTLRVARKSSHFNRLFIVKTYPFGYILHPFWAHFLSYWYSVLYPHRVYFLPLPTPDTIFSAPIVAPYRVYSAPFPRPNITLLAPINTPYRVLLFPFLRLNIILSIPFVVPYRVYSTPFPGPDIIFSAPFVILYRVHFTPFLSPDTIFSAPFVTPYRVYPAPIPSPDIIFSAPCYGTSAAADWARLDASWTISPGQISLVVAIYCR